MTEKTYDVAMSAMVDAANRSARENGRDHWGGTDYAKGVEAFNKACDEPITEGVKP